VPQRILVLYNARATHAAISKAHTHDQGISDVALEPRLPSIPPLCERILARPEQGDSPRRLDFRGWPPGEGLTEDFQYARAQASRPLPVVEWSPPDWPNIPHRNEPSIIKVQ